MKVTRKVRVQERHGNYVWVRLMEGQKSGLDFAVPDTIDYEVGESFVATFEPRNEQQTAWKITKTKTS